MFKTIVAGVDGSDASKSALRASGTLAKTFGADLHVVHTPQPKTVAFAMGAVPGYEVVTTMPSIEEIEKAAQAVLAECTEIASAMGCTLAGSQTTAGHPVDEITAYAKACEADLIVLGRRGLGNLRALVLGSTSAGVSHAAPCAVLTVV